MNTHTGYIGYILSIRIYDLERAVFMKILRKETFLSETGTRRYFEIVTFKLVLLKILLVTLPKTTLHLRPDLYIQDHTST